MRRCTKIDKYEVCKLETPPLRLSWLDSKSEHLAERQGDPHPVILPPWQERTIFVGKGTWKHLVFKLDDNDNDRSLQQPCFKRGNIPKLASHQLNKYKSDKSWQLTPCWTFLRIILIEWFRAQKRFLQLFPNSKELLYSDSGGWSCCVDLFFLTSLALSATVVSLGKA